MEVRDSVLTCKSLVQAGFSGERPIEPPGSWFHPKSSSEELKPDSFIVSRNSFRDKELMNTDV
jgi:hypothetical protein